MASVAPSIDWSDRRSQLIFLADQIGSDQTRQCRSLAESKSSTQTDRQTCKDAFFLAGSSYKAAPNRLITTIKLILIGRSRSKSDKYL